MPFYNDKLYEKKQWLFRFIKSSLLRHEVVCKRHELNLDLL